VSTGSSEAPNLAPVSPGDILAGKYEVERVLGFGGMGVVVAAKHVHLGERVAIKFLLPQALKKAEVVERFLREGRAAVRIKSEHVARVFDVGKLDDGAPYMVMEFLEGADLSTLLKTKGAVPVETAVEYVLQAAEAIAEAHSLKIIHRDLKPANLFVARRADGSPVVKVIDFGISKVADPTTGTDVEMTKTDVMMGSPVYMAPEQMISARDVDERADVWSLGVILFYLVMGAQPFKGNSVTQLYASIIEGPPRMRDTRPDVPAELESAVQKCLQANPKDRWSNVSEMASAIADFGPQAARVSAERVARTLGVSRAHRSTPPPPAVVPSITPPAIGSTSRVSAEASTGPHTDGSWGHTKGPMARSKSRTAAIAIGAVVLLGGAAAGAFVLLQGSGGGAGSSGVTTSAAPEVSGSAPIGVVTISPSVTPTVTPSTTTTASASAGAGAAGAVTASGTASATATASGPGTTVKLPSGPRPPGTGTRTGGVTTKPKSDPFADPH
jgi:serine/threonine-protein kinase